ncbi:ribosome maturation factor RimP [Cesiribacter andamanensis]|uniref:Ribosome maturation factor RimP n=1 Tax=Cesiribacter andamanensis AMV16 TaxID=1279009 RepID=M7NUZ8_9BACT|nr:ribosome maturation factor RimP [Cesiribacter andamanensis]EMR02264.1 Ribosome maturation factor RimP [Cesiribacter andamanensis AMV16]
MDIKKHITALAQQFLQDQPELFLVEVVVTGSARRQKVLVLIDGDQSVTIDQCAQLSRKISAELEGKDLFEGAWFLEVSSPGVDFPLKFQRQYAKHVGRRLKVLKNDGSEVIGPLLEISSEGIRLNAETKVKKLTQYQEVVIPHDSIKTVSVLVSFS